MRLADIKRKHGVDNVPVEDLISSLQYIGETDHSNYRVTVFSGQEDKHVSITDPSISMPPLFRSDKPIEKNGAFYLECREPTSQYVVYHIRRDLQRNVARYADYNGYDRARYILTMTDTIGKYSYRCFLDLAKLYIAHRKGDVTYASYTQSFDNVVDMITKDLHKLLKVRNGLVLISRAIKAYHALQGYNETVSDIDVKLVNTTLKHGSMHWYRADKHIVAHYFLMLEHNDLRSCMTRGKYENVGNRVGNVFIPNMLSVDYDGSPVSLILACPYPPDKLMEAAEYPFVSRTLARKVEGSDMLIACRTYGLESHKDAIERGDIPNVKLMRNPFRGIRVRAYKVSHGYILPYFDGDSRKYHIESDKPLQIDERGLGYHMATLLADRYSYIGEIERIDQVYTLSTQSWRTRRNEFRTYCIYSGREIDESTKPQDYQYLGDGLFVFTKYADKVDEYMEGGYVKVGLKLFVVNRELYSLTGYDTSIRSLIYKRDEIIAGLLSSGITAEDLTQFMRKGLDSDDVIMEPREDTVYPNLNLRSVVPEQPQSIFDTAEPDHITVDRIIDIMYRNVTANRPQTLMDIARHQALGYQNEV